MTATRHFPRHAKPKRRGRALAIGSAGALTATLVVVTAEPAQALAVGLSVSTAGNDSADCSTTRPCKTLARAITRAGSFPGDTVTITLAAGTFAETGAPSAVTVAFGSGAPATLTITGAGAASTIVRPSEVGRRVLAIATSIPVTLRGLTVTGGVLAPPAAGADGAAGTRGRDGGAGVAGSAGLAGGGILATGGTLTLDRVMVLANASGSGARGGAGGAAGSGSLTGQGGAGGSGGAGGVGGAGGGIAYSGNGNLVLIASTIANNRAGSGGAGGAGGSGGGAGGAGAVGGEGAGVSFTPAGSTGTLTASDSTITANVSGAGGAGGNGALGSEGGGLLGGSAGAGGAAGAGGNSGSGAALAILTSGSSALNHVSVAVNTTGAGGAAGAPGAGGAAGGSLTGGGEAGPPGASAAPGSTSGAASLTRTGPLMLRASLLAGGQSNCSGAGTITVERSVATDASCFAAGEFAIVDSAASALGALAQNNGPTATVLPLGGNPAIGAIPANSGLCAGNDQRAVARLVSGSPACAAGAVEPIRAPAPTTPTAPGTPTVPSGPNAPGTPPKLTVDFKSKFPRTSFGWFRSDVTAKFTCVAGDSPVATCPKPVKFTKNGAKQGAVITVSDTAGRKTSIRLQNINIDKQAPKLVIKGVESGKTYPAAQRITCKAKDSRSGLVQKCGLTGKAKLVGSNQRLVRVDYLAQAVDKAGNVTTKRGFYIYRR